MSASPKLKRFGQMVGDSPAMTKVYSLIRKAARSDVTVLIIGETGVGKELVATEIHKRSARRDGPFVAVNMGQLTPELASSALFGHVKGAFTGATASQRGRFAEADGGTLFLDEISTMEGRVQVALLRALETGRFRPVGGERELRSDTRLVAATNVSPYDSMNGGMLRNDILHRLWVFPISVPALRDRPEDTESLSSYFLRAVAGEYNLDIGAISAQALDLMKAYPWPGNVRELRNVLTQAAILRERGTVTPEDLPARITSLSRAAPRTPPVENHVSDSDSARSARVGTRSGTAHLAPDGGTVQHEDGVFIRMGVPLDEVQRICILKTLAYCSKNKTRAARMLGVSRKTLSDKLNRWALGGY
jgi:DNA-binding NtrC family response regulator